MKIEWKIYLRQKENHGLRTVRVCSVMPISLLPMDWSLSSSSVHSIVQAGIMEWTAISYTRRSFSPAIKPKSLASPALAGGFFTTDREKYSETESASVMLDSLWPHGHGILQARILDCIAFPFSKGSSQPRDQTQVFCIAGGFFTS